MQSKRHFRLSPSASSRWLNCPGSLKLSVGQKRESSVYAEEGTQAHDVAEVALVGGTDAECDNPEMAKAVQVYLDEIRSVEAKYEVIARHTEVTWEHTSITDLGGTSDHFVLYTDDGRIVCHVFDYKHGAGVPVDVHENLQVLTYFAIIGSHFPGMIDLFRGTIVQPRAFNGDEIQTWECLPERVSEHEALIKEVTKQDFLKAGDHCRWCPAWRVCPKLQEHTLEVARLEFSEVKDDREKLAELFQLTPAIKAFLDKIPAAMLEFFQDGSGGVPGYKVIETLSNRQWKFADADQTLRHLKKVGLGKKDAFESKLKSPTQVEKLVSKDKKEIFSTLVTRRPSGYKLMPESARGEPVDFSVSEFSVVEEKPDGQAD